jgi:hypothetical protein
MEYLDGQSMHQVVTSARVAFTPIPLPLHLAAISGAIEGLGYAHASVGYDGTPLQVVHRDVSPHNIFITFSGLPKVLDFGIAQTSDSPNMLPPSAGRASYMSPEQAAGESVDARSDLFGLGVMLWEAATRKRFWSEALGKTEIIQALASRRLPETRVSALMNVAPDLQSLVLRATAADREDRYPSATALQEDLQAVLRRMPTPASGSRDLGRRTLALFAHERARLQAAIDAQIETAGSAMGAERISQLPVPREVVAMGPGPMSDVEADPSQLRSEPVPAVEKAVSTPPPIFRPLRTDSVRSWLAQHQGLAVGAIALGLLIGVGVSMLHGREGSAQANRPHAAVAEPRDLAPVATVVAVPAIDREPAPAQAAPSVATGLPGSIDSAVNVEALPHAWRTTRALGRREATTPEVRSGPAPGLAASAPTLTQGSRGMDGRATTGPPLRPIDSINPYGP